MQQRASGIQRYRYAKLSDIKALITAVRFIMLVQLQAADTLTDNEELLANAL
jgi:hypothetical protein